MQKPMPSSKQHHHGWYLLLNLQGDPWSSGWNWWPCLEFMSALWLPVALPKTDPSCWRPRVLPLVSALPVCLYPVCGGRFCVFWWVSSKCFVHARLCREGLLGRRAWVVILSKFLPSRKCDGQQIREAPGYGLGVECPPCIKVLFPRWCYWEVVEPLYHSEGAVGTPAPSSSSLLSGSSFALPQGPLKMCCLTIGQGNGTSWLWTGASKTVGQNKPSLFVSYYPLGMS
jgi:hypothetical protein